MSDNLYIHPTAIIDPGAEIDPTSTVGPYAIIEKDVIIGPHCEISGHAFIAGPCTIGGKNIIGPFTTIGAPPQDIKYKGERTTLVIGDNNQIREYVSIHRGTVSGRGETKIGNHNMILANSHIGHDCLINNHVILANGALGGHVTIGDYATIGGIVGVHQFTQIGAYSYVGGFSGVTKDIPPYVLVAGSRDKMRVSGINRIGLRRCGFDDDTISKLSKAFMIIFRTPGLLLREALDKTAEEFAGFEPVEHLVQFIRESKRGIVRTCDNGK